MLFACGDKNTNQQSVNNITKTEKNNVIEAKVSTQDLGNAYINNAKEAEKKFKGKKLEIKGEITDIREDGISDIPEVILKLNDQHKDIQPRAVFANTETNKVSQLKKGQHISMICNGGEQYSGMVVLENCIITGE